MNEYRTLIESLEQATDESWSISNTEKQDPRWEILIEYFKQVWPNGVVGFEEEYGITLRGWNRVKTGVDDYEEHAYNVFQHLPGIVDTKVATTYAYTVYEFTVNTGNETVTAYVGFDEDGVGQVMLEEFDS